MRKQMVNEEAFRSYLGKALSSKRLASDCISRCRRVEEKEGSLYDHYFNDRGRSLLERLFYSKEEADRGSEPAHKIEIVGNKGYHSIREGTASLRNAVLHYFAFLRQQNP